jgi:dephospho-CoA kinase
MLEKLGAYVIDADQLAREAVVPGSPGLLAVSELFGNQILMPDGTMDRQQVKGIVFGEAEKRRKLEQIIHPEVARLADEQIQQARASGCKAVVYMAPLLIEAGATARVDEIWVVTIDHQQQLKRLMARDNCSRELAEQIIASQMPLSEKESYGVVVIDNSGSLESTREQVVAAWDERIGQ